MSSQRPQFAHTSVRATDTGIEASSNIIDFHCQIFPDWVARVSSRLPEIMRQMSRVHPAGNTLMAAIPQEEQLKAQLRQTVAIAKNRLRTASLAVHKVQPILRILPRKAQRWLSPISRIAPTAHLLVESSAQDLYCSMQENRVSRSLIFCPPHRPINELVFQECSLNETLIPGFNLEVSGVSVPLARRLRGYIDRGGKVLGLYPEADETWLESDHGEQLFSTLTELNLPVLIFCGAAREDIPHRIQPWALRFPTVKFIFAGMNLSAPDITITLAAEYPNVFLTTAWQPAETIAEAVKLAGADKVLFSSGWPFMGNNQSVAIERIQDLQRGELLTTHQVEQIFYRNAEEILA